MAVRPAYLVAQGGPGGLDRLGPLLDEDQSRADVARGPEDVLGEVERGAGEPAGAGHGGVRQDRRVGRVRLDVEERQTLSQNSAGWSTDHCQASA